jgi:hypothetical protein
MSQTQQTQIPFATAEVLDAVAVVAYKKKLSVAKLMHALKNRRYIVEVDNNKYKLGNNGAYNVLNRVRGLAMDRKTGQLPDWFNEIPEDGAGF